MKVGQIDDRNPDDTQHEHQYLVQQSELLCGYCDVPVACIARITIIVMLMIRNVIIVYPIMVMVSVVVVTILVIGMAMKMIRCLVGLNVRMGNIVAGMTVANANPELWCRRGIQQ